MPNLPGGAKPRTPRTFPGAKPSTPPPVPGNAPRQTSDAQVAQATHGIPESVAIAKAIGK